MPIQVDSYRCENCGKQFTGDGAYERALACEEEGEKYKWPLEFKFYQDGTHIYTVKRQWMDKARHSPRYELENTSGGTAQFSEKELKELIEQRTFSLNA